MKRLIFAAALVLAGCSSKGMLLPQADGSYVSRGTGSTSDAALAVALNTAQETCRKINQRHVIIEQQVKYANGYRAGIQFNCVPA